MSYLFNSSEILQTIDMISQQHLDVRTITMGISLLDCASESMDECCRKTVSYTHLTLPTNSLV